MLQVLWALKDYGAAFVLQEFWRGGRGLDYSGVWSQGAAQYCDAAGGVQSTLAILDNIVVVTLCAVDDFAHCFTGHVRRRLF